MAHRRFLYLDADVFFASCELAARGLAPATPLVVCAADEAPVADGHSVIAETRAARAAGVRRGMRVGACRARCPDLVAVPQRPDLYVRVHHRMVAAVERVLPVDRICSIDEVLCTLGAGDDPQAVMAAVGRSVGRALGPVATVSLGVAASPLLAKMAAESDKPSGRVWWPPAALPAALGRLPVDAVPGLGPARAARLEAAGLAHARAVAETRPAVLRSILGTVEGARIGWSLRGWPAEAPRGPLRSLSCARVLVPGEHRHVRAIVRALVLTVLARARGEGRRPVRLQATGAGTIGLSGAAYGPALRSLGRAWRPRVAAGVRTVTVAVDLAPSDHTHPLPGLAAAGAWRDERIAALVDAVHARFGCAALDYGGVRRSRWMGRKIAFDRIPDPAA